MIQTINKIIFRTINNLAAKSLLLDKLGIILAEYTPYLFIFYLVYLFYKKKIKITLYSLISLFGALTINLAINFIYFHPRPFIDDVAITLINHAPTNSFPSTHALFMFSIAFMLLYFKSTKKAGVILSVLALLGGLARVFCGVHYPIDVIGSILIAALTSSLTFALRKKIGKFTNLCIKVANQIK